eukprot:1132477-Amphidinium_carterae.2
MDRVVPVTLGSPLKSISSSGQEQIVPMRPLLCVPFCSARKVLWSSSSRHWTAKRSTLTALPYKRHSQRRAKQGHDWHR